MPRLAEHLYVIRHVGKHAIEEIGGAEEHTAQEILDIMTHETTRTAIEDEYIAKADPFRVGKETRIHFIAWTSWTLEPERKIILIGQY